MDKQLEAFIANNQVATDLIFRDWDAFLETLFDCGGCVEEILWFEYILADKQTESLGYGGYFDKENPQYMWAETDLYNKGLSAKSLSQIREHIKSTIDAYSPHNLVPCFFKIVT
ncbi:MAG: hypothetical protein IJX37_05315 [Oscillospiraceae bacterium]|nr:hypothetical protein [Oscillospiraceae bacterium]